MRMLRQATVTLSRPAPKRLGRWTYVASGGVRVDVMAPIRGAEDVTEAPQPGAAKAFNLAWSYDSDEAAMLVQAVVTFQPTALTEAAEITVPDAVRVAAEDAIREYADLLSVIYQCERTIRSPSPGIAVAADNDLERALIRQATGLTSPPVSRPRVTLVPELRPEVPYGSLIADRLDGVAMLGDAMSEASASARARELFRFFERAFATGPSAAGGRLAQFMRTGDPVRALTDEEVTHWFMNLRSRLTHADRHEEYARNRETEPYLARIEVAAYDVLFNKAHWHSTEIGRRSMGLPLTGAISADGTAIITHPGMDVRGSWLDPFGSFTLDFKAHISLSKEWFHAMPRYQPSGEGSFRQQVRIEVSGERQWVVLDVKMRRPPA